MTTNESWRRFLDTGMAVGQVTLTKANEIAKGLIDPEPETRARAWQDLDDLGRASRHLGEQLADLAKSTLMNQLGRGRSLEDTLDWVADLVSARTRRTEPAPGGDADRLSAVVEPAPAVEEPQATRKKSKKSKTVKKAKNKERAVAAGGQGQKAGASGKKKHKRGDGKKAPGPGSDRVLTLTLASDSADRR